MAADRLGRGAAPPRFCPWCGAELGSEETCAGCGRRPVDSRVGITLMGRYRIDAILAQGGIGRVYRATHLGLDGPVAIKFLLARWAAEAEWRARFQREATTLARLRHPSIVAVHDFGEQDGTLYIVMELIDGVPLSNEVVVHGQTLPLPRLGGIFEQILQVLEASHGAGIVHRDMKPENVMLLDAGDHIDRVKVLDFGIALVDGEQGGPRLTAPGMARGTPHYMSPEQCRGERVGPATDVYAVGVMLYELLAGALPFVGRSQMELMAQHIHVEPPPIRERGVCRPVPPALERLVRWAMAKRAEDRPRIAELRDALHAAILGGDVEGALIAQRARQAGLPREQRGLPLPVDDGTTPPAAQGPAPCVLLLGLAAPRAEALRAALLRDGVHAVVFAEAPPPQEIDGHPVRAIVLGGAERQRLLHALAPHGRAASLPVLVIDVARGDEVPGCIRAGASDVALAATPDSGICHKLARLIRRGR